MSAKRASGVTAEGTALTVFVGLVLACLIMAAVTACNTSGGGGDTYYYPQTTHYGYYDHQHHYHYYPKYNSHSKVYVAPRKGLPGVKVKPAPRSGGGSVFRKSSGSGYKSGGSSSRRR